MVDSVTSDSENAPYQRELTEHTIPPTEEELDSIAVAFDIDNRQPHKRFYAVIPSISYDDAHKALQMEVKKHPNWKSAALRKIQVVNVEPMPAYLYQLETFTEQRTTANVTEAMSADDPFETGEPPIDPWDVEVYPGKEFTDDQKKIPIPGTISFAVCQSCSGNGASYCFFCHGNGWDRCNVCNGTGMRSGVPHPATSIWRSGNPYAPATRPLSICGQTGVLQRASSGGPFPIHSTSTTNVYSARPPFLHVPVHELCMFCRGTGGKQCSHCKGTGNKPCSICSQSGRTKTYVRLTVSHKVIRDEFLYNPGDVPDKLLRSCNGTVELFEQDETIRPLLDHPNAAIAEQSKQAVNDHRNRCISKCKILSQRQTLMAIPMHLVKYDYKHTSGRFWVFGPENRVYIPEYPKKCAIL